MSRYFRHYFYAILKMLQFSCNCWREITDRWCDRNGIIWKCGSWKGGCICNDSVTDTWENTIVAYRDATCSVVVTIHWHDHYS